MGVIYLLAFVFWASPLKTLGQSEGGKNHPCFRPCEHAKPPLHCVYNFTISKHSTMSLDCGKCPYNRDDCQNPRCIPGGGLVRTVIAVNRMIPGPQILVCEDDAVTINVKNELRTEAVTIHWHGIHQEKSPFMDGVPWITQIPIAPYNTFVYNFSATPHGTHLWHGHSGYQESDGLFGVLTVRRKEPDYIESLYDYDLPEHGIIIWHWYNQNSQDILLPILQRNESVFGYGFLINGKAAFEKYSWSNSSETFTTPKEVFRVRQGYRYRFRVAYNAAIYCPVQLSIDDHHMVMIAGDTSPFEPIQVDSFMLGAGDRFDFVLHANNPIGCYWLRMRAFGDCDENKSSVHAEALICYNNSTIDDQKEHTYIEANRPGVLLNPAQIATHDYGGNQLVSLVDLNNTEIGENEYSGVPNDTIYIQLHSRPYDVPYPGPWHQFDNVSFQFPGEDFLRSQLKTDHFCTFETRNKSCSGDYCSCPYIRKIKRGSLVELILVDISYNRNQDHPVHLHGNSFYIVAMGVNKTINQLKEDNKNGLISKKLSKAPQRDSISVPNRGFAVVRFLAKNIGFWMFHCHVTNHMEMGMAMVFQIGTREEIVSKCKEYPEQCQNWYNKSEAQVPQAVFIILAFLWTVILG